MSALQAIPTQHGIDILNSELKNTVTKYQLIGALTHDALSESLYSFHEDTIETSYYDENGVLTFILNLPIEQHFDEYLHQIHVLDSTNQSVIECSTPKVALAKGIGGMVTLKAAISGEAGEVIFKHNEFVTETELVELHLSKYALKAQIQALPHDIDRTYYPGDTCTSVINGVVHHWEAYHDKPFVGKDPNDEANRQVGWTDDTQPWYWSPLKKARPGTPLWPWMSMTFPEGTLNVVGNSVPVAVFWRLATAFPEFVNAGTGMIDFPETGGEFFRVLDQGRGVDVDRGFGSWKPDELKSHKHTIFGGTDDGTPDSGNFYTSRDYTNRSQETSEAGGNETRPRSLAFPIIVEV